MKSQYAPGSLIVVAVCTFASAMNSRHLENSFAIRERKAPSKAYLIDLHKRIGRFYEFLRRTQKSNPSFCFRSAL